MRGESLHLDAERLVLLILAKNFEIISPWFSGVKRAMDWACMGGMLERFSAVARKAQFEALAPRKRLSQLWLGGGGYPSLAARKTKLVLLLLRHLYCGPYALQAAVLSKLLKTCGARYIRSAIFACCFVTGALLSGLTNICQTYG